MSAHISLQDFGALLGSRWLGMKVRATIEAKLDELEGTGQQLVIDAEGVQSMSHSFADECFGRLVEHRGLAQVMRAMAFRNVPPEVGAGLRYVIGARTRKTD